MAFGARRSSCSSSRCSLIVMIHEVGHYLGARRSTSRSLEYFVGFGPRLWSFRRGEIEYGVKAIPAGGYVKIAGMNPFENDVPEGDEHRAYGAKPVWQRVIVILAGPLSHFLVACADLRRGLHASSANWNIPGIVDASTPTLDGQPSPAAVAGLQPGDVIVQIGDLPQPTRDRDRHLPGRARRRSRSPTSVDRDGQHVTLTMTPVETRADGGHGRADRDRAGPA